MSHVSRVKDLYICLKWGLTAEKAISLFESVSLDCSDRPVESSSVEEMSIHDTPVTLSPAFQNVEHVYNSFDKDLEKQSVPKHLTPPNALELSQELTESYLKSFRTIK
ncbi:hypothetical protein NPIL_177381 [Nephila pilipes]|uniref:Uncharacterized protein n=1 Tax=Nephila pilipes TaxID=299642 RepID=A0A8X6PQ26_NEPPI|nr:hypothetical protein NPIL_177381 [Nephila pilipes]